jgi:hypothetical protein
VEIVGYAMADEFRWIARYLARISEVLNGIGTGQRERKGMELVTNEVGK